MRYAGITVGDRVKVAIFSKANNQLTLDKLEEYSEIPQDLFKEKNLKIISGLSAEDVVRRDLSLELKNEKAILKALPFQLESLLPFPLDETLVYPFIYPGGEVVVFATTKDALQKHIDAMGVDRDQISCTPLALAQFSRLLFPDHPFLTLHYGNTAIALEGKKVVFSQSMEDEPRLQAYLKNKFSHFFTVPTQGGPGFQNYTYEHLFEYAVPIGLALEGLAENGCQFRQGPFVSSRETKKKQSWMKKSLAVSLGLAVIVGTFGTGILSIRRHFLHQRINQYFTSNLSLDKKIEAWEQKISKDAKAFPLVPDLPSAREVVAWLSELQEPVDIIQFNYTLVQYPKAGGKHEPYSVKVDIEFTAENPEIAHRFQDAVEKAPTFIDKNQKVQWSVEQNSYKLSFNLRKI